VAWSIYLGWVPWPHANESGIPKKRADKYGVSIEPVQMNDCVESLNQDTTGAFDGVLVTNVGTLSVPLRAASTSRSWRAATPRMPSTARRSRGKSRI